MSNILMRVDGSCYPNPGTMGIGVVIYKDDKLIKKISQYAGQGTNNIAEYKALICGLEEIKNMTIDHVKVYCDSQLVVKQLNKQFKVKDKKILPLFLTVQKLSSGLNGKILFIWNGRENNSLADGLAKKAVLTEEIRRRKSSAKDLVVQKEEKCYIVKNPKKKETHFVDLDLKTCDCLDFKKKAKKLKIPCKHIFATQLFEKMKKNMGNLKIIDRKMKILITSQMVNSQVWEKTLFEMNKTLNLNLELFFLKENNQKNIEFSISDIEIIIGHLEDEKAYFEAKSLKLIQIPFAGVDKINFEHYKKRSNVYLCNVHANKHAVAEHTMSLIFALSKMIIRNDNDLRKGVWHGFPMREPTIQLYGKKLGIVGLGSIGWEVAKIGYALGMKVFAIKRNIGMENHGKKNILEFLGTQKDLKTVIKISDFIVLSVPLTDNTKGLISEKELNLMQAKYLINVSRGEVIDEKALYLALKNRRLAGAAVDVWYQYPNKERKDVLPSKYDFHHLSNVLMSPHIAGYTDEALKENMKAIFENIVRVYRGEEPVNQINLSIGY